MGKEQDSVQELSLGEKRWYVIGIYKAARMELIKEGLEFPTDKDVADHISKIKNLPASWMVLEHLAGKIRGIEFGEIRQDIKSQHPEMLETNISRLSLAEIERRYQEIDKNPDRNNAFLDDIIFQDDK